MNAEKGSFIFSLSSNQGFSAASALSKRFSARHRQATPRTSRFRLFSIAVRSKVSVAAECPLATLLKISFRRSSSR